MTKPNPGQTHLKSSCNSIQSEQAKKEHGNEEDSLPICWNYSSDSDRLRKQWLTHALVSRRKQLDRWTRGSARLPTGSPLHFHRVVHAEKLGRVECEAFPDPYPPGTFCHLASGSHCGSWPETIWYPDSWMSKECMRSWVRNFFVGQHV